MSTKLQKNYNTYKKILKLFNCTHAKLILLDSTFLPDTVSSHFTRGHIICDIHLHFDIAPPYSAYYLPHKHLRGHRGKIPVRMLYFDDFLAMKPSYFLRRFAIAMVLQEIR